MRRLSSVNMAVSFVLAVGHCLAMVIYQKWREKRKKKKRNPERSENLSSPV